MTQKKPISERNLAALTKQFREQSKKSRAEAAREMGVSQTSIFHAEESPGQSLVKLRTRMIENYSPYRVTGPIYFLEKK